MLTKLENLKKYSLQVSRTENTMVNTVLFIINWTMTGAPTDSRIVGSQCSVGGHVGVNGQSLKSGRHASGQNYIMNIS